MKRSYFDCVFGAGGGGSNSVKVICDAEFAGVTISCSDGVTTLTQTCPSASPYEVTFNLPNQAIWTISATIGGVVQSTTFTNNDSVNLHNIPVGTTATPTDDIQTWLHCANIWDLNYSTIGEIISDYATLMALVNSSNAADYMVRSTTWASSITANQNAMTIIGANNICADKLLSDSTWRQAIGNSAYFEDVLTEKIPTMTSNTTPSGVANGTTNLTSYDYYKAFDNNTGGFGWFPASDGSSGNAKVWYEFPNKIKPAKFLAYNKIGGGGGTTKGRFIGTKDNGSTWQFISDEFTIASNAWGAEYPTIYDEFDYVGMQLTTYGNAGASSGWKIQVYGRT